ncbi:MAG: hypothetical protein U9R56_06615, partial [candidate division Zixibacteria bacterium]|nr:hypothetical protein [candidate division Zixibacteria bacterium]
MKLQTSLRTRILLLAVLVAVGTGVLSSLVAGRFMEEALEKELEKQSEMISQMLADRITTHVINNDIVSVREALLEVVTGTEGVEFAYVVNFDGRIMAHTFQDGFPVDFMEAESGNSCRMHTGQYMAGQKPIMIVNHPLVEGLNAHIHIGMDESRAFSRIEKTQNTIMLTTLGVILLGILFGFVLSTRVVKPLAKLTVSLRAFGEGKSRDNIVYKGGGLEVAELTGSFNRMITDRERMDEKLRLSEVRFRNLFDQMSSGVAVYEGKDDGKDFIFKDFNSASERIDKMNRGDVIGKSVLEVFQGVKEFGLFEVFQRVWKTGKPEYFPVSLYKDERIAGWRDNYVYKLPSGEIVAVYDDVTSQKQAEEALRKSEEKFRMLFQGAAEGILIADVETR